MNVILYSTMEGFRIFLESSTIHGLAYISTTKRISKIFWIFAVISGFTTAAFLIHTSFKSWADSPIKTTVEKFPISEIKFPKVTVCPPRGTYTDLNYDLMLAENTTFEKEQARELTNFIYEVVNNHIYMDVWRKLNEDNSYFNWYHGYTRLTPPENHSHFGDLYKIDSSALSGVVTTEHFGEKFQQDIVQKKIYYEVIINPPDNFLLDENITLHFKVQMVAMAGQGGLETMFIMPDLYELEPTDVYLKVSPPVTHTFQFQRNILSEDLSHVRMDIMPGFKISWHYTGNDGIDLGKETNNRIVPIENHELVK